MIKEVIETIYLRRELFVELTIEHIQICTIAIVIAAIIGLIMGMGISHYERLRPWVLGITNVIYTIPAISLLGFFIPITGIGDTTAIIALILYGLLPMIRNTYVGITEIDDNILEAAKGMGSTKMQVLVKIKLPLAMPVILSGLRNMVVMTIALAGIASFIGAGGLGEAIYRGITTNNEGMTIAGSLLIAVVALLADGLFGWIEKRVKGRVRC